MESPTKKPGRPSKLANPMTGQQRAATHRARRYEAAGTAHENLDGATTAVLLAGLARQLKATSEPDYADVARHIAARLITELCNRHGIDLT